MHLRNILSSGVTLLAVAVLAALPVRAQDKKEDKAAAPAPAADAKPAEAPPAATEIKDVNLVMKTSKGEIEIVIYASKTPVTAASFLNLASRGFYNGITFHRVIADFMIQGGDPTGTGRGGPGYRFEDETATGLKHDGPGILSMANSGPATNGSQFFITHKDTPHLDGKHTVFGKVTKGQDVVNSIAIGDKIESITIKDSTDALFAAQKARIDEWNKKVDQVKPAGK